MTRNAAMLCAGSALVLTILPRPARADVRACIKTHASGQREAKAGRLKRAAELFAACGSSEDCPAAIRADCVEFYRDTERDLPTVIFRVVDEHGNDRTDVRVYEGQELLAESLDGHAVPIDPGEYRFDFALPEGATLHSEVLVREGEKNRAVSVTVPASGSGRVGPRAALTTQPGSAESSGRSLPSGFWVSAGVGGAALASWGIFALLGHAKESALGECSPRCSSSHRDDFDAMRRDYLFADISLGVAIASVGVAAWLYFPSQSSTPAEHSGDRSSSAARVSVAPLVSTPGAIFIVKADAL